MASPETLTLPDGALERLGVDPDMWPSLTQAADRVPMSRWTLRHWVDENWVIAARSARNGRIHVFWPSLASRASGGQLVADGTGSPAAR
jgi:hypothetical protein